MRSRSGLKNKTPPSLGDSGVGDAFSSWWPYMAPSDKLRQVERAIAGKPVEALQRHDSCRRSGEILAGFFFQSAECASVEACRAESILRLSQTPKQDLLRVYRASTATGVRSPRYRFPHVLHWYDTRIAGKYDV